MVWIKEKEYKETRKFFDHYDREIFGFSLKRRSMEIDKRIFILVEWPNSQFYINSRYAYFLNDEKLGDSTYFVRKDFYDFVDRLRFKTLEEAEKAFKIIENKWEIMKG